MLPLVGIPKPLTTTTVPTVSTSQQTHVWSQKLHGVDAGRGRVSPTVKGGGGEGGYWMIQWGYPTRSITPCRYPVSGIAG